MAYVIESGPAYNLKKVEVIWYDPVFDELYITPPCAELATFTDYGIIDHVYIGVL